MNNQLPVTSWQTLLKKSVAWGIWLLLLAVLQTSFFSVFRPFGAVPNTVLSAVVAIAVYDRERMGSIAGVLGGVLIDSLGSVGLSFSPLAFLLCGSLTALLCGTVMNRGFVSFAICSLVSFILSSALSAISALLTAEGASFMLLSTLKNALIPEILSSFVIGIPIYLITKLIWSKFFDNREMTG